MDAFKKVVMMVLAGGVLLAPALYAKDDPGIKFARGLTNIVASPGEYYVQTSKLSGTHDPLTTLFGGMFKGTCAMVGRIGVGAYDVLTFPLPFPAAYQPLMQPATVIDAVNQQRSKQGDF